MVTIHNMESCVFYKQQPEDIYISYSIDIYIIRLYTNTTIYSMAISNSPLYMAYFQINK